MKLAGKISAIILLVVLLTPGSFSQGKFEGKVIIETSGLNGAGTLTYYVSGDQVRFDIRSVSGEANVLFDKADKKIYMIMPAMKMYMEFPMDYMKDNPAGDDTNAESAKFERTGQKKTINGYSCEKWTLNEGSGSVEAWMTKDLGSFVFFDSPMGKKSSAGWQKDIEGTGYFPMLVIQKNSEGQEISKFNVLSVVKMNLYDSFFKIPDGYTEMKMPMGGEK